jgi:hypothetical protein
MTELFLIAHKVRGEPAFDIATPMEVEMPTGEFEEWWIIPTSGHRAYPYWHMELHEFSFNEGLPAAFYEMPSDLPDHYTTTAAKGEGKITNLFQKLFKPTPSEPINRRI